MTVSGSVKTVKPIKETVTGIQKANGKLAHSGPVDDFLTLALFVLLGVWLYVGGMSTQFVFGAVCTVAVILGIGPPSLWIAKQRGLGNVQANKSREQWWQLIVHVAMTVLNFGMLSFIGIEDELWSRTPHPVDASVERVYVWQAAIWFVTAFRHRFFAQDARNKDYVLMYVHHVVTLTLVVWSYANDWSCHRGGALVLIIHDASDIVVDILRLAHNLSLDASAGIFLAEISFAINLLTWAYFRLFRFSIFIESSWRAEINWQHSALTCITVILLCMHVYWYYLFIRIAYKLAQGQGAHHAGRDYEGDSGDEGLSARQKRKQKESGQDDNNNNTIADVNNNNDDTAGMKRRK